MYFSFSELEPKNLKETISGLAPAFCVKWTNLNVEKNRAVCELI